jgi:hypothetical protein
MVMKKADARLKRIVAKHTRDVAQWCTDSFNAESLRDRTAHEIDALASGTEPNRAAGMGSRLGQRAVWFAQSGLDKLLRGDGQGWEDIERSRKYKYWSIRILARAYDLDTRERKQWRIGVDHVAPALAHAIAANDEPTAAWLGQRMEKAKTDGVFGNESTWTTWSFAFFIADLFRDRDGTHASPASPMPAVYPPLLQALGGSDESFRDALLSACDYHVVESVEGRGFQAYIISPYHLLPAELVATLVLRRSLGASVPAFEHPLFATKLVPTDGTPLPRIDVADALLDKAIDVAQRDLPGV